MGLKSDFMGFYGDLMGIDLINEVLWWFHGIEPDFMVNLLWFLFKGSNDSGNFCWLNGSGGSIGLSTWWYNGI